MKKQLLIGALLVASCAAISAQPTIDYQRLGGTHDLSLPDWGPYTKNYMGISHIASEEDGVRFDLSVFPGLYRRKTDIPHAMFESGFHAWEASPNLDYFSFRHDIEWKDQLYADISYSKIDDDARLVRMEYVNNTPYAQNVVIHMMASMHFPTLGSEQSCSYAVSPQGTPWIECESYSKYNTATITRFDHLMPDGLTKGAQLDELYSGASAIKIEKGSSLQYRLPKLEDNISTFAIRYSADSPTQIQLSGAINESLTLEATAPGEASLKIVEVAPKGAASEIMISYSGDQELLLDGFALLSADQAASISFPKVEWGHRAEEIAGPIENSVILKYPGIDKYYGISWEFDDYMIRRFHFKDLSDSFKRLAHEHNMTTFEDGSDMSFFNIFMRPIFLEANSKQIIEGVVYCGDSQREVEQRIKQTQKIDKEVVYNTARQSLFKFDPYPEGETYRFSQEMEVANLSTNIVFPIYTQNQYIRHHTPGRWWNSLYTWDCGFVGLGFSQIDIERAIESLNTYTNDIDEAAAFMHHGSLVPVQIYLFQEIWSATQSRQMLEHFYPRLKRYYEFFMARLEGASTRDLKSGMIRTWDYFYNSGGWDDYPPQKECASGARYAPVVNTAHTIRFAKILKMAAKELGVKADVKVYDKDIDELTAILNKYSWDPEAGYFSYVVHDEGNEPIGIYRHSDGSNFNKGLDGASPFVADICNEQQQEAILAHLQSPEELWCSAGLSTVDQSASYYRYDGYWNGAVWMPHQWFFWRALLDAGQGDFAFKIAKTALDMWKRETERTYNCYEHFIVATQSGAGWHQFGGLSTPVLAWYKSYFQKGSFTTGLNVWIKSKEFSPALDHFKAQLQPNKKSEGEFVAIICMNPDHQYTAQWQGRPVRMEKIIEGVYNLYIPYSTLSGELIVERR